MVAVNVNNNTGAQVPTRQLNGPQGPATHVQIDEAVANALGNGSEVMERASQLQGSGLVQGAGYGRRSPMAARSALIIGPNQSLNSFIIGVQFWSLEAARAII